MKIITAKEAAESFITELSEHDKKIIEAVNKQINAYKKYSRSCPIYSFNVREKHELYFKDLGFWFTEEPSPYGGISTINW